MSRARVLVRCVLFGCVTAWSCGPVLLFADSDPTNSRAAPDAAITATAPPLDAAVPELDAGRETEPTDAQSAARAELPEVELSVQSSDCGKCYDLTAIPRGGMPPYRFEWEDGSTAERRRVCVDDDVFVVSVIAEDASSVRSRARVVSLQPNGNSAPACRPKQPASGPCLMNPSFEGTAAVNTGQVFDAPPWSQCVDPAAAAMMNTPDIASDTLDPVAGIAPVPSQGSTYLALAVGEQASQALCAVLPAQSSASLKLDAMRFDLAGPDMFLQIWGGSSASCSQDQLLWVSPALNTSWITYCVSLAPNSAVDQLTLRAATVMGVMPLATNYLAVDNLVSLPECP